MHYRIGSHRVLQRYSTAIENSSMYVGNISLTGFFNIINFFNPVVVVVVTVLESGNLRFG